MRQNYAFIYASKYVKYSMPNCRELICGISARIKFWICLRSQDFDYRRCEIVIYGTKLFASEKKMVLPYRLFRFNIKRQEEQTN